MMEVVDLFCGCGGLSLGFIRAGYHVTAAFDNWDKVLAVYRRNFTHQAFKTNLMDVERSVELIEHFTPDMIIGGPPCQDFSSAGKRNENNGRGDLTIAYAKIIATIKPEWFVMENVARITKTQKLALATDIFKTTGYGISQIILDATRCHVPQKRKRFFMIGKLGAQDNFIIEHFQKLFSEKEMSMADYFGNHLGIKYFYRHPRSYVRRGIFSIEEPCPTVRGVNRPIPKGYSIHPGDPVRSLEGIRPLSTKERSMVQTFPYDFVFEGSKTDIEQMVGNAVPVNLGVFVGNAILSYLGQDFSDNAYVTYETALHDKPSPSCNKVK